MLTFKCNAGLMAVSLVQKLSVPRMNKLMKNRQLLLALLTLSLVSCGVREDQTNQLNASSIASANNGAGISRLTPASCATDDMKSWVRANMLDYYLFSQRVDTNLDVSLIASPEAVTTSLRVQPEDNFSYMTNESTYNSFFNEGQVFGYGWNFARASNGFWFFSLIEPASPLDQAGVLRGDQLLSVNGTNIDDTFAPGTSAFASAVYSSDTSSTIELRVQKASGAIQTISVSPAQYTLQTVLESSVLQINSVNVGYLAFFQFLETSSAELDVAFSQFANDNISELILDLRFNGGGRVDVANDLASYLIGGNRPSDVFARFTYNQKYQGNNFQIPFKAKTDAPQLNRVFVLQSANTCSASELIVNSLRAHMEVITIGDTSCGKPYATTPNVACSKVLNALEIDIQNADGAGGYFQGITADCPVAENVSVALGNVAEPLLGAAVNYINTGACGSTAFNDAPSTSRITHQLTDPLTPDWRGGNVM